MTKVLKRDGSSVAFDQNKIVNAIKKAGFVREDVINKIVSHIEKTISSKSEVSIEDIQDMVEDGLMKSSFKNVAKEYIRYRNMRERIRNTEKCNDSILRLIDSKNEYLKTENSNKNIKIASTQRDYIAGEVSKELSKRLLIPQEVVEAHEAGSIHFHDADYFIQHTHNCFSSSTRFITTSGVKSFKQCKDGDIVKIIDMNGVQRDATVHKYGRQSMQLVTLKRHTFEKVVRCTSDHRWILIDGSVTTSLKVGDRLWNDTIVSKIVKDNKTYDAWCVEEPITQSFTLEGGIVTGNCALIDLENILQNGTVINGTMIERPHSFPTACNIATQVAAIIASNQYGGQTMSLSHLAPFVDVSRQRLRKLLPEEYVEKMLREEVRKGVQMIQYQINTLNSSNGQTPFITIFAYLNEAKNEREKQDLAMIIEEVLKQRIQGVKNEVGEWITPAFPKIIFAIEDDNCKEGTKYWWLTELAAKCTAKRMVPDYISEKKMKELKGTCFPSMGLND